MLASEVISPLPIQTNAVKNEGTVVDVGTSPRDNAQSQVGSSPIDSAVSNTPSTIDTDGATKLDCPSATSTMTFW